MADVDKYKKDKETVEKKSVAKKVVKKTTSKKTVKKAAPKKATEAPKKAKSARLVSKKATSTILRPVVSEKSAVLAGQQTLVFKVATNVNKIEVRNAFRELYNVTPVRVNIMNVRGKRVRVGKIQGKRNDWKKALITLPEGKNVDIFEGV